eukprot:TRINITY_DN14193_c0_g1_i2.p1 TRINITY_DN14193_c0_g1~~TRINITY_DN14193_c0_g1_i2.p1  ORF type:complete len:590 (+),score=141.60 TRINITY_DN14193_c0_g1_i2:55-1770(+)
MAAAVAVAGVPGSEMMGVDALAADLAAPEVADGVAQAGELRRVDSVPLEESPPPCPLPALPVRCAARREGDGRDPSAPAGALESATAAAPVATQAEGEQTQDVRRASPERSAAACGADGTGVLGSGVAAVGYPASLSTGGFSPFRLLLHQLEQQHEREVAAASASSSSSGPCAEDRSGPSMHSESELERRVARLQDEVASLHSERDALEKRLESMGLELQRTRSAAAAAVAAASAAAKAPSLEDEAPRLDIAAAEGRAAQGGEEPERELATSRSWLESPALTEPPPATPGGEPTAELPLPVSASALESVSLREAAAALAATAAPAATAPALAAPAACAALPTHHSPEITDAPSHATLPPHGEQAAFAFAAPALPADWGHVHGGSSDTALVWAPRPATAMTPPLGATPPALPAHPQPPLLMANGGPSPARSPRGSLGWAGPLVGVRTPLKTRSAAQASEMQALPQPYLFASSASGTPRRGANAIETTTTVAGPAPQLLAHTAAAAPRASFTWSPLASLRVSSAQPLRPGVASTPPAMNRCAVLAGPVLAAAPLPGGVVRSRACSLFRSLTCA